VEDDKRSILIIKAIVLLKIAAKAVLNPATHQIATPFLPVPGRFFS